MALFRCIPIESDVAERFRRDGVDDGGNVIRRVVASGSAGAPCRHCLRYALPGEAMLLASYHLPRPNGIYWTPSPIFVHAEHCDRFEACGVIAPIVRQNSLVSLRSYDAAHQCLYDLGAVCSNEDIDAPLERAVADERTAFLNIHTARPGCLLCRVEKIEGVSETRMAG